MSRLEPRRDDRDGPESGEGSFENCVGAGRLEGWFCSPSWDNDKKGWGHLQSYCFEAKLFFHLQRSASLRGVTYRKKDPVFFEVVEFNGRHEAVKLMLPSQLEENEEEMDESKPEAKELVGKGRFEGVLRSHWQLVKKQNWGFCCSSSFRGMVFWHLTDNPDMTNLEDLQFDRGDVVEFDLYINETRGQQVRARNMKFLKHVKREDEEKARMSAAKQAKKAQWLANWRKGPPPDWNCKSCGYQNFGRNKVCKNCPEKRPPREEWPAEEEEEMIKAFTPNLPTLPAAFRQNLPVQFRPFTPVQPEAEQQELSHPMQLWQPEQPQQQEPALQLEQQFQQQQWEAPQQEMYGQQQLQLHQQQMQVSHQPQQQFAQSSKAPAGGGASSGSGAGELDASVQLCLSSFNDVVNQGASSDEEMAAKVKKYLQEALEVMKDNKPAKQAFSVQLARHPWFAQTGYEVRYRPGQGVIDIALSQAGRMMALKRKADSQWPGY
eukprot:TRINITY_DN110300_c0_g1_i1.p1 TRINITY_DN110300_c0_g1~~TRINITY_DN110300_c0_g1_i1.p1  ORF type:complete len:503 (+),score=130.47 TRINITY_DN110300_c0_g1_i1:37-1509(+)